MNKLFEPLGAWAKVIALGLILSAAGTVFWWVFSSGEDAANKKMEDQNDKAISDADLAAYGMVDCNSARLNGQRVRWDFGTSKCVRAKSGSKSE